MSATVNGNTTNFIVLYILQDLGKKSDTPPHLFINKYNEIRNSLQGYIAIFTDGSKCGTAVAAAALSAPLTLSSRLPDNSSIFSAESQAINLALDIIEQSYTTKRFAIFSDSLSCLKAIENRLWNNPLILSILNRLHNLILKGNIIVFVWVPSHTGIRGNAEADMAAKSALTLSSSNTFVPSSDFKPLITTFLNKKWQRKWDSETNNKLHSVHPKVGSFINSNYLSRRDERVLHRLRIGHSHLTHAYLLKKRRTLPNATHATHDLQLNIS